MNKDKEINNEGDASSDKKENSKLYMVISGKISISKMIYYQNS